MMRAGNTGAAKSHHQVGGVTNARSSPTATCVSLTCPGAQDVELRLMLRHGLMVLISFSRVLKKRSGCHPEEPRSAGRRGISPVVYSPEGEIPRFARNDTRKHFFSALLGMLPVLCSFVDYNVTVYPDIEGIQGVPGPVAVELRQDYKLRLGAIQTGGARW